MSAPAPRDESNHQAPTSTLDSDKTYRVVVETNCGEFTITLDQQTSPKATASFVSLAEDGYFDDTIFHRIVPGFVIQGGDPTGGGNRWARLQHGRPSAAGHEIREVRGRRWRKTQTEPPGTAGSQFFVVTAPDAQLTPDYAVLGKVTDRPRRGRPDRQARRPDHAGTDAHGRHREGDGRDVLIAAIVLAAGAATRFGSPKQRLLLAPVLDRVRASTVDEVVVVIGAYQVETEARTVKCIEWERGPGASLRCGLDDLSDEIEAAVVVLADGPNLHPFAIDRVIAALAGRRRRRSSPRRTAVSGSIRC